MFQKSTISDSEIDLPYFLGKHLLFKMWNFFKSNGHIKRQEVAACVPGQITNQMTMLAREFWQLQSKKGMFPRFVQSWEKFLNYAIQKSTCQCDYIGILEISVEGRKEQTNEQTNERTTLSPLT